MSKPQKKRPRKKPANNEPKRPRGQQPKRTPEICDRIIEAIAAGSTLTAICKEVGVVPRSVYDWIDQDPAFASRFARARLVGFDAIAEEALLIADSPMIGEEITESEKGYQVKKADMTAHRRLQVETRLKLLAKWDVKRYGDKVAQEISGPDGKPLQSMQITPEFEAEVRRIAERQAQLVPPAKLNTNTKEETK